MNDPHEKSEELCPDCYLSIDDCTCGIMDDFYSEEWEDEDEYDEDEAYCCEDEDD